MPDVAPRTVAVYSDLTCPWAHLAVHRLHATRQRLDLDEAVTFDHRAFPLEVFNERPTPWRILSAEVPVVGGLDPDAGWEVWQAEPYTWPVTSLLAMEAVQAAKEQGLRASERLDRALRAAFFAHSRCISSRHVILAVASAAGLDVPALQEALDDGRARRTVFEQQREGAGGTIKGSPHLFLADGTEMHNPGIQMEWAGEHGRGFPVVSKDDPGVYEELLRRAAEA